MSKSEKERLIQLEKEVKQLKADLEKLKGNTTPKAMERRKVEEYQAERRADDDWYGW